MADFKIAYNKTNSREGGYVNDPKDSGGETYKGISRVYNPDWAGWYLIDIIKKKRKIEKGEIIQDETIEKLHRDFVKQNYWDKIQGDSIPNQDFANFFYDFYFHKPKASVEILQDTLGVNKDGKFGKQTLNALLAQDVNTLYPKYYNARKQYYESGGAGNTYKKGFLNRVKEFPAQIEEIFSDVKKN